MRNYIQSCQSLQSQVYINVIAMVCDLGMQNIGLFIAKQ